MTSDKGPEGPAPLLAEASAPAKLILLGEHAVVYGQPALALPLPALRAEARVYAADHPFRIEAPALAEGGAPLAIDLAAESEDPGPLAAAAIAALHHAGRNPRTPWLLRLSSRIPVGRGLGSSAAVAVALVRAIGQAAEEDWDAATVATLAFASERKAHGTASGVDNTVIAHEAPIRFARGRATPLAIGAPFTLLVADSGQPGSTRAMVAGVRERREARAAVYEDWFARIGRLVDEAAGAIAEGDLPRLGRLMSSNHLVLQAMRVSTPRLDALVAAARHAGALGAKLSGAGGGGIAIALVRPEHEAAVGAALRAAGGLELLRLDLDRAAAPAPPKVAAEPEDEPEAT